MCEKRVKYQSKLQNRTVDLLFQVCNKTKNIYKPPRKIDCLTISFQNTFKILEIFHVAEKPSCQIISPGGNTSNVSESSKFWLEYIPQRIVVDTVLKTN